MSSTAKVVLYTTPTCPYCIGAKRLLAERSVPYREVDVSDPALRAKIRAQYDWPTVPVVIANGEVIGGFSELSALDAERGLEHLR